MEFEDQEGNEGVEMELGPSYDSAVQLPNNSNSTHFLSAKIESPEPTSQRKPRYRECLKNHAVGIGGHAVDGCCEFLPAGADGTLDALKCAACNCHRNFHRREALLIDPFSHLYHHHHQYHQPPPNQLQLTYHGRTTTPSGYLHVSPTQQHIRPLALPSTSSGRGGGEQEEAGGGGGTSSGGRKRHRTKFSQEQKEKMLELAEKLGWRIQKQDEEMVQSFCNEFGIRRHVLKVWMHNNKHTIGKKNPS